MAKPMSQRVFEKYDEDKSGTIDAGEFKLLCYDMGHHLNDQEVQLALGAIGTADKITYADFQTWWKTSDRFVKLEEAVHDPKVQQAIAYFQFFDKDKSGTIDQVEFKSLHADLVKNQLTTHDYNSALATLDENNDGVIKFNEYMDWLKSIGAIPL